MKLLHVDIETAPNLCYTWGLWNQNIAINQIVKPSYILSWAAKWHKSGKMMFRSCQDGDSKGMIEDIYKLVDEADAVCHFNGTSFDMPRLNQEFHKYGLTPPSPYAQIDLFRVVAKKFDLPSRKLDYVVQHFGLGKKVKHPGMDLWVGCLNGDEKSWKTMEKYNRGDVKLLEDLYKNMLPWIDGHPNRALFSGKSMTCTNCGSAKIQSRGSAYTPTQTYRRYRCNDCGKWMRERLNSTPKDLMVLKP